MKGLIKKMEKNKVYFASPFFTPEQVEREERLKNKLRALGYEVWSPKENFVCPPNANSETRAKTFKGNVKAILESDIVFAVTDGKDVGTIWEAGFAFAISLIAEFPKIVYYCETLNGGQFNLMLAESGNVVITDFAQLDRLPELLKTGNKFVGEIE